MFVTDLHEDISYAIWFGGFDPVANRDLAVTFDRDLPGRHGDIPKYRRAGVKLVFGAIFPGEPEEREYRRRSREGLDLD